jgi:competence protein ComFA
VLFAAPRQDVVLDVAPRLKRDFPELTLSILTGISLERFAQANFVLATTHQVLRFYQAFDLIFLDEMDAFPYHGNAALAWGLQHALKPSGKIIYLTATPSTESLEKIRQGKMQIIRLPARHHRRPLPVPEWIKYSGDFNQENSRKTEIENRMLIDRITELTQAGPVVLFVPKISWVNPWVGILRKAFPQWKIEGSYSSDPQRREKIAGLRSKSFQVFVSTSILERGVTLSDVQVIVLAADHEIFDERALVQMAGRVGRTQENPGGRALFLAKKKTPGIEKAIQWIEEQNELAHKQGLID